MAYIFVINMANITNNIKMKDSSGVHDITKMYFKNTSGVNMIKSVWEVKNSNSVLIWPKNYDAVLTVTPSPNTITGNRASASGVTINLTWHLTLYYPTTNIIAYESDVSASRITGDNSSNTSLLRVENYKSSETTYEFPVWSDKSKIEIPNRGRNGLPAFTGPDNIQDPKSDGSWGFFIDRPIIEGTYNGGNYSTYINNIGIARQEANSPTRTAITPTNVQLNCYNDINLTSSSRNTQNNPANYTQTTVYGRISGTLNYEYTFTSGATYVVKHYVTDSIHWAWGQLSSDSSWAIINTNTPITNNERFEIVLRENTTKSARKAVITLKAGGESHSFDVWQAGAPDTTS